MNTRPLGKDGPQLTEIGLGAWAIGGPWAWGWGDQDDTESIRTIHAALDAGVNWIDTAAVYGLGHGEVVVGRAIAGKRKSVFVATKCGLIWDDRGRVRNNNHPQSIRRECENSLRRLQIEQIDLYQIHWPDPQVAVEDSWGEMTRLQEEGKVRFIGVSNFGVDLLEKCMAIHPVNSVQPPFNLAHRDVEKDLLPWCLDKGVGVIAYSPLQSGLLTGKFNRDFLQTLAADDWRRKQSHHMFKEPVFSRVLDLVDGLRPIAERYGKSVSQLAIAWVLMHPAVTAAIVGARKVEQAQHNAGGAGWKISPEDMAAIQRIYEETVGAVQ